MIYALLAIVVGFAAGAAMSYLAPRKAKCKAVDPHRALQERLRLAGIDNPRRAIQKRLDGIARQGQFHEWADEQERQAYFEYLDSLDARERPHSLYWDDRKGPPPPPPPPDDPPSGGYWGN